MLVTRHLITLFLASRERIEFFGGGILNYLMMWLSFAKCALIAMVLDFGRISSEASSLIFREHAVCTIEVTVFNQKFELLENSEKCFL